MYDIRHQRTKLKLFINTQFQEDLFPNYLQLELPKIKEIGEMWEEDTEEESEQLSFDEKDEIKTAKVESRKEVMNIFDKMRMKN